MFTKRYNIYFLAFKNWKLETTMEKYASRAATILYFWVELYISAECCLSLIEKGRDQQYYRFFLNK